jgi:hypothetical protein
LSLAEVEAYLAAIVGTRPPSSVSARLHAVSGGNPFFLGEVVLLRTTDKLFEDAEEAVRDPLLRIPEEVRALIRRHVAGLSQEAVSVLRVAAVIGREFDVRLLQSVSRLSPGRLLDVLAEAADSGLLFGAWLGSTTPSCTRCPRKPVSYSVVRSTSRVISTEPSSRKEGRGSSTIWKPRPSSADRLVEGSSAGSSPGKRIRRRFQNSG